MNCNTLIENHPDATDDLIKDRLESNICCCTSYKEIEEAVKTTLEQTHANNKQANWFLCYLKHDKQFFYRKRTTLESEIDPIRFLKNSIN